MASRSQSRCKRGFATDRGDGGPHEAWGNGNLLVFGVRRGNGKLGAKDSNDFGTALNEGKEKVLW